MLLNGSGGFRVTSIVTFAPYVSVSMHCLATHRALVRPVLTVAYTSNSKTITISPTSPRLRRSCWGISVYLSILIEIAKLTNSPQLSKKRVEAYCLMAGVGFESRVLLLSCLMFLLACTVWPHIEPWSVLFVPLHTLPTRRR